MGPWIVFVGAGLGGMARYGLGAFIQQLTGAGFPWGTLLINVTGSLVLAFTYAFLDTTLAPPEWRLFIGVGICGGYTTFSTFSLDTVGEIQRAEYGRAALNITGNVGLSLLGTFLGFAAANAILAARAGA